MKPEPNNRRVVVTGLGVVSSIGIGWQEFWKNLLAGKSGIKKIRFFDTSSYDRHFAGEITNFKADEFIDQRKAVMLGRSSQMAIAASVLALKDAKLSPPQLKNKKSGVCIGTTMGEPQVMEELDSRYYPMKNPQIDALSALRYPASSIAGQVAQYLKLKKHNIVFSNACAAGNYAVGRAYDLIRTGKAEFMLAGGADALSRIAFTGFSRLFAMAPEKCQPFDKNRKGMLVGEGTGIVFLETLESAQNRKAHVYAEVLGYGLSCDARHMTAPAIDGITRAISSAIKNSGINPGDVDYISAHGTGTIENDKAECKAIAEVFKDYAKKIPVSSIKSMLGHTMGAAAALESIACCLAIDTQQIPPTINFQSPDENCPIDCVPNRGRKQTVKTVLNNSQAFGGNNACLVFRY